MMDYCCDRSSKQRSNMGDYYVYMLLCAEGSYYVGITNDPKRRLAEHNLGTIETCYTYTRRPVRIVHCCAFHDVLQAISWEKQLKGWSRAKKRALAGDDWRGIHLIVTAERKRRG